jgi:phage-related protein
MALPSKNSDDMSENQELAVEITDTNDPALGGFPQLIQPVKHIALKHLQKNIKALFSNIDDSMFEYADKADSNQQQSTYFEAMRQLRLEKKSVAQQYFKVFDKYFVDALNGIKHHGSSEEATTDDFSYTSLSLLEEDDLEESLAFNNKI